MSASTGFQLVIMGVSGCGKSTFAKAISQALHLSFMDGDDLHSPHSVSKMQAGIALEDSDRWPWLDRIGSYLAKPLDSHSSDRGRVVACSALKLAYRNHIRRLVPAARFIFLDGDIELIRSRMAARAGHFMQLGLLESQLHTLERPTAQEPDVLKVNTALTIEELLATVIPTLQAEKLSDFPNDLQAH